LNYLDRFSENSKKKKFMKIRPVEGELFSAVGRAGERTDRLEKNLVIFRNFANVPKKHK
jgi:hypothetical protein